MTDSNGPGPGPGVDLERLTEELDARLGEADTALERGFPGERSGRQPVHTVYVPADRFHVGTFEEYGGWALWAMDDHETLFLDLIEGDLELLDTVRDKLGREPIEDLRIDFEDGYGLRDDDQEDDHVRTAAAALRQAVKFGTASAFQGIRFKSLERATRRRGLRTLALFLEVLVDDGPLPDGFVVTLPKVTSVDQVEAMVHAIETLERGLGLGDRALSFEIQVETPQSIIGPDGTVLVARMIHASDGRCTALHYGTYDYSAFCGIAAAHQSLDHPVADHAKEVMQAAAAGTGVRLSDGSTNILPVGEPADVREAWATHLRLVRRSLERGFYQGWDMHPAQLPTRYAATFAFYRSGFPSAAARLRNYIEQTSSAILDEPATARALADFLLRGLDCGAVSPEQITAATGVEPTALAALAFRTAGTPGQGG
jgi:citrate lyase beta subunit